MGRTFGTRPGVAPGQDALAGPRHSGRRRPKTASAARTRDVEGRGVAHGVGADHGGAAGLGDIGRHALDHIQTIAEIIQRQENRERDEAERDQVSNLKNNFKKFKPMSTPTGPTVAKTEDSGDGLGL